MGKLYRVAGPNGKQKRLVEIFAPRRQRGKNGIVNEQLSAKLMFSCVSIIPMTQSHA